MKTSLKGVFVGFVAFALNAGATTPVITSQPQNQTINIASTANFTVVADNAATYQWLFGTNVILGATNATLMLDDVTTNQAGPYSVVVTSSTGDSTNSQPAQLTLVPGTIVQLTISTYADGSSSNFLVQLFNHDKPATVENFIHYITSGSYSNTFFDRDVTNFVLQGGDYVSYDRTTNALNASNVSTGTNIFPSQVDNEFNVGPFIPNRFGTLAMALVSGEPDSATSAFFFNLADNSTNLDTQRFTVFGRILSGTNILQFFNTLTAPTNGIYDVFSSVPTLPVNYDGTNSPTDANFFYCDFAFQTPPPVDTTPPTVLIAFPAPNAALTNGSSLTVTGMASDNVGLAEVFCVLTSTTGALNGAGETNAAVGTTNWSLNLTNQPGIYQLTAYSQDGAGNLSAPATEYFTNMVQLTLITNVDGQLTTNTQYLVPGQTYSVASAPGAGEAFEYWQSQGVLSLDPVQSFTAETNLTFTVTYVSNSLPAGLEITSPLNGSTVQTAEGDLTVTGLLPTSATVTTVTCQLFSQSNAVTKALSANLNAPTWSLALSNLVGGPYTIVVVAEDSSGREGLISENFTALVAPPVITSQSPSVTVNIGSSAEFSVVSTNAASYQWQLVGTGAIAGATSATLTLDDVTAAQSGSSYYVVLTAADGETTASTPVELTVVPGSVVQLTLSKFADGSSSNIVVQLFDHDKPATVANFIHYVTSGAYTNMFFDRCVPGFVLQGGTYDAFNRTNANPGLQAFGLYSDFSLSGANSGIPFPDQVDSEFGDGPFISNTFGTLAMALTGSESNSATSAFFINLADNSANLDFQAGGFTVFGRVVSGTNVLQFFNTLSNGSGIIDYQSFASNATETTLPVNYVGTNEPSDTNL